MRRAPGQLITDISNVVDPTFARQIIESYVEGQQRYLAGDWKPSELDGGRLCEAVARALYQLDSGIITHSQLPGELKKKMLDEDGSTYPHKVGLKDRQHIIRLIETIYKFRSDRGAVHISPTYDANGMDSMLIIHGGKWILGEFLRIAWNQDRDIVAGVIEQLVQLEISLIHQLDGKPLVLVKDISAPNEVLLLLYQAVNNRLSRSELRSYALRQKPNTLQVATARLIEDRDVRVADDDDLVLTPKGQKRVMERILPKLETTSTSQ